MALSIAFVGTGENPQEQNREGFAMAYKHANGYRRLEDTELVACADVVPENANQFAEAFDIEHVYDDYREMVRERDIDIVSVSVPPDAHADIVTTLARLGDLEAIHCEKPMATTWGDSQRMVEVCEEEDVKLTFNHQKRLGETYNRAKGLVQGGSIGDLQRIEVSAMNLFDSGSHWVDLCDFFLDGEPVEWVIGQIDYREENRWFGVHNENQALAQWRYANGVYGLASMGVGEDAVGAYVRLVGGDGVIEIGADEGPPLRIRHGKTVGWNRVDTGENIWGDRNLDTIRAGIALVAPKIPLVPDDPFPHRSHVERAVESVVRAVRDGSDSTLSGQNALRATEVIFAAWESARRRERVELPLEIEDNPLTAMLEAGQLPVAAETAGNLEEAPSQ